MMYMRGEGAAKHIRNVEETGGGPLYNFLLNKWYIDELYDSKIQSGYLYHYAFVMLLGVAVIIALVFRTVGG